MDSKEINCYAPVIIPTLCRYEHFKRCVESLSQCTHAEKTELYIGLDYPLNDSHWEGYRKIKNYIPSINGFLKVVLVERDKNYGARKNSMSLYEMVIESHESVIFTEDDNYFSPNFLDYINKGLTKYKDNNNVISISGYNFPIDMAGYPYNVYFSYQYSAWGTGWWAEKNRRLYATDERQQVLSILNSPIKLWKIWKKEPRLVRALINCVKKDIYGDTLYATRSILDGWVSVFPTVSKVRNYGQDGSGNSGTYLKNDNYRVQELDADSLFVYDDIEIKDANLRSLRRYVDIGLIGRLSTLKRYIQWRVGNKKKVK